MKGSLAIAAREFAERRVVIWAAMAAAVLPFMSPLLPGVSSMQGTEARDIMCLILATALGLGSTLLVGSSVIARDLSEGRMGFDFSRPIGALSIWAGRFLGAFGVVVAALAVVAVPTVLAAQFEPGLDGATSLSMLFIIAAATSGGIVCLLPLAHAASISLRSKSLWLAADLIGLVIVALTGGLLARALITVWALQVASALGVVLAVICVIALWIASVAQVTVGRTDLRRGHRAQALALWSILLCALLAASGCVAWVLSAGPHDLVEVEVTPAPSGDWVGVSGPGRGRLDYRPALLVNARDGRTVRLGGSARWTTDMDFSEDGRRAVWVQCAPTGGNPCAVITVDLNSADPVLRHTSVVVPGIFAMAPAVSPDGKRLAYLDGATLSIHDLDSGRVEASARVNRGTEPIYAPRARFTRAGKLRLYFFEPRIEVYEFDPEARSLVRTGAGPKIESYSLRVFSPDGERLVVRRADTKETLILDARSAAILASHPRTRTGGPVLSFLHDGRIVVGARDANGARLHILTRDGAPERILELTRGDLWSVGGEPEADKLLLTFGTATESMRDEGRSLVTVDSWLIDLSTGTLREIAKRRAPSMAWGSTRALPEPGSCAGQLFHTGAALVRIDSRTGAETVIAGRVETR